MATNEEWHAAAGRKGAIESWKRTGDRAGRTAPARAKSPASIEYWVEKVGPDRAEQAKREHFANLAARSAEKRRSRKGQRPVGEKTLTYREIVTRIDETLRSRYDHGEIADILALLALL